MSNAPPPSYSQASTAYPTAPPESMNNPPCPPYPNYPLPGSTQLPYPPGEPYPAAKPYPPAQPYQAAQSYPPAQPYQAAQSYPPAQPYSNPASQAGYNQSYPPTSGPDASGYGANRYEDDDHMVMSGNDGSDGTTGWVGNSFSDKNIRHAFIKKVYLILMTQLCVTLAFVCFFLFYVPVQYWVHNNSWFYWCAYGVFLVTYFTLVCCDSVRRRWPGNFICLAIFTLAFSYMTGTISSYYNTESVAIALGVTAAVCLSISIFAIQTKIDFTMCFGLIFALSMTLLFVGFACIIVYVTLGPSRIIQCVYGGIAALIFAVFLVFDTQMVIGGQKRRYQLSAEEHIYGALQLYLDVVNLFILILGLVGGGRRS